VKRTHLVLVPGFGGFDALGQMRYYTGVTERCQDWLGARGGGLELHYFDNLPTAAVATRARDLEEFLVKRVHRHAFQRGDELVLLGHSTGGLDIRYLLRRLRPDVRALVKRVVFMSVPHYGTNIADFVDSKHQVVRGLLFGLRHFPWVAGKLISLVKRLGVFGDSQLVVDAIDDLRRELEIPEDGWLAAEARRARAELALWRDQTASDFLAIRDLKTRAEHIEDELADLDCLSFATIAPNPLDQALAHDRYVRDVGDVWSLARDHAARPGGTDPIFRLAYAACSAGPFARSVADVEWFPDSRPDSVSGARRFLGEQASRVDTADLAPWHNDSIVNTASMVWPRGKTWLVGGDHADIIGHYEKRAARAVEPADPSNAPSCARQNEAYDLLRSDAGFSVVQFRAIWDCVFDFAAGIPAANVQAASA
jgi:hypothetical protein